MRIPNNFPIISFYTGGGFLDMGFEEAGFNIVWTNEYDQAFAKLYSSGISSWRKSTGYIGEAVITNTNSITEITVDEILKETKLLNENFGVIGGPPCQDFSNNGRQRGFDGERGKLTIEFLNKISQLKPSFFVMENVKNLIRRKDFKQFLFSLLAKLKDYYIDHDILNALDFGVPQFRERVFIVGFRKDFLKNEPINESKWFPFPMGNKYYNAYHKYDWPKMVIKDEEIIKPKDIPSELFIENYLIEDNHIDLIPNANEICKIYTDVNKITNILEGETNRPSFKRLHRFRFSPTACYGNNEVHLHPYKNRRLSVRETLRIQGVPDTYILPNDVSLTKKFRMIGNGVPPPLSKSMACSLKDFIHSSTKIK